MPLGFIRFFATTNDTAVGSAALAYLQSLLRLAPVRVISKSGQLEGPWRRFEQLLLTPMSGTYVSCVCTPPQQWIWEASVPMPAANLGAQGAAQVTSAPAIGGVAKGTQELYTEWAGSGPRAVRVRNVLFVVEPPQTDAQRKTAARYEAVLIAPIIDRGRGVNPQGSSYDERMLESLRIEMGERAQVLGFERHQMIRAAVLGYSTSSEGTDR